MDQDLLTVTQTAEKLQLHAVTVRRMLRDGKLPGLKFGKKEWRVPVKALREFIESKTRGVEA